MATLNSVHLIGRLTRDPQIRTFANGGKVANFGLAIDNKRKDQQTGEYINEPVFIDCDCFNGQFGAKLADLVEQYLSKGKPVFVGGKLKLDQWNDQNGNKRSAIKINVTDIQFLEPRQQGQQSNQEQGQPSQDNDAPPQDDMGF